MRMRFSLGTISFLTPALASCRAFFYHLVHGLLFNLFFSFPSARQAASAPKSPPQNPRENPLGQEKKILSGFVKFRLEKNLTFQG